VKISLEVQKNIENSKIKSHNASENCDYLVQPPGPLPMPIIGNLAVLGKYDVPFEGFSALSKIYGDVYSLTLGSIRCVVVNSLESIKEVLNQNGKFFGGRPNFEVSYTKNNIMRIRRNFNAFFPFFLSFYLRSVFTKFSVAIATIVSINFFKRKELIERKVFFGVRSQVSM
jgi:hypothetical protein